MKCADCGQRGRFNLIVADEFAEFGNRFVARIEHDRIGDRGVDIE